MKEIEIRFWGILMPCWIGVYNRKSVMTLKSHAFWRTGWDSNPRAGLNTDKLISSQPRYDHFDTCPCVCLNSDLTEKKLSKL